ncbi:spore protease YyaC [Aliibacillus thermotolerans]|uniref:Spore protease YyaC n=1 Tax=Aliibacillus thermotolerans TaxID=1834418 RepID=A0ABW0U7U3_9BACI|nr:spore protease YyaC [Aliibacillus thermotolerans]MDA3129322.1 spore protease YyaC [Aliibacillus thermotolerans]
MMKLKIFPQNHYPFSYHVFSDQPEAPILLGNYFTEQLQKIPNSRDIVLVCIGTDRSTGDSLGPLIGNQLEKENLKHMFVYGTLSNPVHAVNLHEKLMEIKETHDNPYIIGIDACLGRFKNIGKITFAKGPVIPGAAMKKQLPHVGDAHVTGIVNVSGMMEYFVLQNTRLYTVMTIANCIAEGFILADRRLKRKQRLVPDKVLKKVSKK